MEYIIKFYNKKTNGFIGYLFNSDGILSLTKDINNTPVYKTSNPLFIYDACIDFINGIYNYPFNEDIKNLFLNGINKEHVNFILLNKNLELRKLKINRLINVQKR